MSRSVAFRFSLISIVSLSAQAGILITRSEKGLQFTDAAQVVINGKDKALTLGGQPKLAGPINKLKDTKLGGTLIKDVDSGVVALFSGSDIEYVLPENLGKTPPADPAEIWKTAAKIAYKKAANDKVPTEVPSEHVRGVPGRGAGGADPAVHGRTRVDPSRRQGKNLRHAIGVDRGSGEGEWNESGDGAAR